MPNILKRFMNVGADAYVFPQVRELAVEAPAPEAPPPLPEESGGEEGEPASSQPPQPTEEEDPISFARVQAEAILQDARREAEEEARSLREEAMAALDAELSQLRAAAREEGHSQGYEDGLAAGREEARKERDEMAAEQIQAVEDFLTTAAKMRDTILDESREELKDLALAIAEKVIRVSLKNSSDILLRMVDAATDTHKRCEWAHIYVADCDIRGKAYTVPELASALRHISDRVRVIPMADDESGTCIVELPDVIYDASVSTQMSNIREVLSNTGLDEVRSRAGGG